MEQGHTGLVTNGTEAQGRIILNTNPQSPPDDGSQYNTNTSTVDSNVISRATKDINQEFNSKVKAPKCKPGMVFFVENFKKKVIFLFDQFLANI